MIKALERTDFLLKGVALTMETTSSLKSWCEKITIPSLIGDPDAPVALLKNPTRTVAIKQMTCEICPRHIEKALAFCESNISGFFLGSSDSVAYVEFEVYFWCIVMVSEFPANSLGYMHCGAYAVKSLFKECTKDYDFFLS